MSVLLGLRAAIIADIATELPQGWSVDGHLGRFTAADLTKFITVAPAVRVAVLGLTDPKPLDADAVEWRVKIGVFVVTKDQGKALAREEIAAAAVETIILRAFGSRWSMGPSGVKPAEATTAQTIFNDDTLRQGIALWAIDWSQPVVLSRDDTTGEGETNPLKELWVGIAPDIGAAHRDDYIGPFPSTLEASDV